MKGDVSNDLCFGQRQAGGQYEPGYWSFCSFTFTALMGTEYRAYFLLFLYIWVYELTSLRSAGPRAYVRLIYFSTINCISRNVCCRGGNGRPSCLEQFPVSFVFEVCLRTSSQVTRQSRHLQLGSLDLRRSVYAWCVDG